MKGLLLTFAKRIDSLTGDSEWTLATYLAYDSVAVSSTEVRNP